MSKRIAHIISEGPTEGRGIPATAISPGFETGFVQSVAAPFPGDPVNLLLTEISTVEAAMRAQQEGYDGVLIGALADYGLAAARAAVDIPVVGCGQASLLTAAGLSERYSIVTIWPETQSFLYDRLLSENHAGDQCVSVRYVTSAAEQATLAEENNFYTEMRAGKQHMIERILQGIEAAVAEDGAQAVILGCNCMTPVAPILAERASVPVVDPSATGYRFLEMLVGLGLKHAKDPALPPVSERASVFSALVKAASIELVDIEDCAVCVLSDDGTASCDIPETETITAS
ncbi:Asp/Glu/hydantoin racemase [Kribbella sp. VKM Ac-2527]|uniref:Asp/Glu/hydantoin racemase n=1 Tax=Kribbella caucasensis TaxID=2512215 RepID=A0A4R6KIJ7_9ACTN|nr:aspartate/glutamate racemase family protein [Kribbella sp. VKM Ac-2527]TDO50537.1 Asp/Glu/hydantoin racemase [Kribbella sp. VKM Ac-2527]